MPKKNQRPKKSGKEHFSDLQIKQQEIFSHLLANAGQRVLRTELKNRIWGDSVTKDMVNFCIRKLRRELCLSGTSTCIRTVPHGYLLEVDHGLPEGGIPS